MKKTIIFVHTEYHLILAINHVLIKLKEENGTFEIFIMLGKSKRLSVPLDFSGLPVKVNYFKKEISIYHELEPETRREIEALQRNVPDIFIFFQEMDALMCILSSYYHRHGAEIYLFQDGLKPYNEIKIHSFGLLSYNHKQNLWLKKNNFPVESWLSPIYSKKYAFLKSIDKLYLTFPESYVNWNNKAIEKIELLPVNTLKPVLSKLFKWDDSLMPEKEKVFLFLNQPTHDDGIAEADFLRKLSKKYPENSIYIKLHPRIEESKVNQYKLIKGVKIIRSALPAELFIINLNNSIILSLASTAMFYHNPNNKYYYLYKLFKGKIKHLDRYEIKKAPADHIISVKSFNEIKF